MLLAVSWALTTSLVFVPLLGPVRAHPQDSPIIQTNVSTPNLAQPMGLGQRALPPSRMRLEALSYPSYDEQLGMTFTQNFTSLAYNVTAVEQTDPSSGTGPAYLLNGVSDQGYWYQVGLSWNWDPGYTPGTGFDMVYTVFDSSGTVVYPSNGQYLDTFGGQVNQGDVVLLNLYFSPTQGVAMLAKDYSTGASAHETYSAMGATEFVGSTGATGDSNGFFTGLMTEWYHSAPYYGNVASVLYSNPHVTLTSGWMWIDEFSCPDVSCSTRTSLFWASTPAPVSYLNSTQRNEFDSHGATEYSDAYEFITGPLPQVALTMCYSIQGGGSGYSAPVLTYRFNGVQKTAALATTPTSYQIDTNTAWGVTGTLSGSTTSERWETNQLTSGTATSALTMVIVYNHQYALTFTVSPLVAGTTNPNGVATWQNSGALPVGATPNAGYTFLSWNSSVSSITFADMRSATTTATISGAGIITANFRVGVTEQVTVSPSSANSQPPSVAVSGCHAMVSTIPVDGRQHAFGADASCTLTFTAPRDTVANEYRFSQAATTWSYATTPSGSDTTARMLYVLDIMTCAYSVSGGGTPGFPVLSYTYFGSSGRTLSLSMTPQICYLDDGTGWSLTNPLSGSTPIERWDVGSQTGETTGGGTIAPVYYHQCLQTVSFAVIGGGSPTSPTLAAVFYGSPSIEGITTSPAGRWLDTGSTWNVTNPLAGSTTSERWRTNSSTSGIVSDSGTLNLIYYHQYAFTLNYGLLGGGSPSDPSMRGQQFGQTFVAGISLNPTQFFLDSGSKWTVPTLLPGSNGEEQWESSQSTNGTVVSAFAVQLSFQHQYRMVTNISPSIGGQITNLTGWYDLGTALELSATAGPGWKFVGWIGSGASSYSGPSNSTLISVSDPTTESATFYPGLKITASSEGSVFYSFGSSAGIISPGTSTTVYAPYRSNVSLEGTPSSFLYAFAGWTGAGQGKANEITLPLTSPVVVRADFSYNVVNIAAIGVGLGGFAAIAVLVLWRRSARTHSRARAA